MLERKQICPGGATGFTHFDEGGRAHLVDVGAKPETCRSARASAIIRMRPATVGLIRDGRATKGDVLAVARLAGIMAAKKTADLIPLCHPLSLTSVELDLTVREPDVVRVEATVALVGRTGVEMEALTAVSVAALTVYDMCKAVDRGMSIEAIRLEEKNGGASGHFQRLST